MGPQTLPDERRYRRFSARDNAFAVIRNRVSEVGQLINVSRGGLAFKYLSDEAFPHSTPVLDIFLAGSRFFWQEIPHRTVLDIELIPHIIFSSIRMRRRGIAFENLNQDHLLRLESLLDLFEVLDPSSPAPL